MKIKINAQVGDNINHLQFGEGVITEIADQYISIDFKDKKGWKCAIWPHPGITVGEKTLCEMVFDGPVGNYEFDFEYAGTVYHPHSTTPILQRTLTFDDMTEKEAADQLRDRVTSYGNYDGGFFINKVTQL